MVLSMTLYFQVVNNTRSAENSFLYNSKVILLTGDPSQNERWKQFIMADSFNGLRYYRVHLMQLHHIHVSFFCLRCVMAFTMSAWCVIGAPPFPPPPPPSASFANLYQHSPTRLVLIGSPTRSSTLGTRLMDPTNPPTHPHPHGTVRWKKGLPFGFHTPAWQYCIPLLNLWNEGDLIFPEDSHTMRLLEKFSSFVHFKS